jgi:5-methylcytosine-specific restriction endonuclease McrA
MAVKKKPRPCAWGRCASATARIKVADDERYCVRHGRWIADKLVGDWVKRRDGACQSCFGTPDQWAHIVSRGARYIQYEVGPTSYTPGNSIALCAPCHYRFTNQPAQWAVFVEKRWPGLHTRLIHKEIDGEYHGNSVDLAAIIVEYREKAA